MNIYLYDKRTLEYKGNVKAEANPEETKLQGKFVPLIPANATLIEPPSFGENEIPVFNGNGWTIYPDFRGKYFKVNQDLSLVEIKDIGMSEDDILVDIETGREISENPKLFAIKDNKVVRKSAAEIRKELVFERKNKFEAEFFNTSLGWIKRKVTMQDGSIKDFLSDLILPIKAGLEMNREVNIITYDLPDFEEDFTQEYAESLQKIKLATMDFVGECLSQIVKDFGLEGR